MKSYVKKIILSFFAVILLTSPNFSESEPLRRDTGGQIIGRTDIILPDNASKDGFSRLRMSQPFGIWDSKNVSSRNRNQWEEDISGIVLTYNTLTLTFTPGEEIRGTLPAQTIPIAIINTDNGASSMNVDGDHNDFQVGDTITGQTSGATAVIVSTNTGSDIQHNYDEAAVEIRAGPLATDHAIRQTHKYHAYVPGKSQLIVMTGVMGASKANVTQRMGIFDDLNGIFLQQTSTGISIVKRSNTSGSPVDTAIDQADWNVDRFNGTQTGNNPSRINLDLSKAQILVIDYQWLGVGRVRVGFDMDGEIFYAHEFLHANIETVVYMRTPTLPIRYEIRNTGVPASATTLKEICASVASEGGYRLPGLEFTKSTDITPKTVTTTLVPVFAIRLKANFPAGQPNRKTARFLNAGFMVATNDAHLELLHVHEPVDVTATWTDIGGGSVVEYSTDISAFIGRPSHEIEEQWAPTAQAGKASGDLLSGEFINLHGFISQSFNSDNSEMFVVMAQSFTGNSDVSVHLTWVEFE
ncbi:hypothetical protein KAR91_88495 [Candidatus Pacearchaeota archaeon]|nr:hypothetical protein [Candidatus Pacearchaeota archaeon]